VIIYDLNVAGAQLSPRKADSVLLVDTNAVLALPISREALQSVSGRNLQFLKRLDGIELIGFSRCDLLKLLRAGLSGSFRIDAIKNVLGSLIFE